MRLRLSFDNFFEADGGKDTKVQWFDVFLNILHCTKMWWPEVKKNTKMETWFPHPNRVHYRRQCQLVRDHQRGRFCQPEKAKYQWILLPMKSFWSRFTSSEILTGTYIQMAFVFCGKAVIVINYFSWKFFKFAVKSIFIFYFLLFQVLKFIKKILIIIPANP